MSVCSRSGCYRPLCRQCPLDHQIGIVLALSCSPTGLRLNTLLLSFCPAPSISPSFLSSSSLPPILCAFIFRRRKRSSCLCPAGHTGVGGCCRQTHTHTPCSSRTEKTDKPATARRAGGGTQKGGVWEPGMALGRREGQDEERGWWAASVRCRARPFAPYSTQDREKRNLPTTVCSHLALCLCVCVCVTRVES